MFARTARVRLSVQSWQELVGFGKSWLEVLELVGVGRIWQELAGVDNELSFTEFGFAVRETTQLG